MKKPYLFLGTLYCAYLKLCRLLLKLVHNTCFHTLYCNKNTSASPLVEMKSVSQGSQGTCPLRGPNLHKIKKILANRGDKQVTGAIDERRGISCVRSMSTTDSVIPFRENPSCLAMLGRALQIISSL